MRPLDTPLFREWSDLAESDRTERKLRQSDHRKSARKAQSDRDRLISYLENLGRIV